MNKVRISKKHNNQLLGGLESGFSPNEQASSQQSRSFRNSVKFQKLKLHEDPNKNPQKCKIIYSHRYKMYSPGFEMQDPRVASPEDSYPKSHINKKSMEVHDGSRKSRGLESFIRRSKDKSPYLSRKSHINSQKKIILSARNDTSLGSGSNFSKHLKPVRFNSLEQRSNSLQLKNSAEADHTLREAKRLMVSGQSRKSLLILKSFLNRDPNNAQALYMTAVNFYNIADYKKSAEYLDAVLKLRPNFSFNAYILRSRVHQKDSDGFESSIAKLEQCLNYFPEIEEVYYEMGSVYMSHAQYAKSLQYLEKCHNMMRAGTAVIEKMIEVHFQLGMNDYVLETVQKFKRIVPFPSDKYELAKCRALANMGQYSQIIQQFSDSSLPQVLYHVGYSLHKLNDNSRAYLVLQASLNNNQDCRSSIKTMLLILCLHHDFYEAYHLLQRCAHLNLGPAQLKVEFLFVEGTLCMMKRNIKQGIQKLNAILEEKQQVDDDFSMHVYRVINAYLGYGYLCIGEFEKCQACLELQKNSHRTEVPEGMEYNYNLNKAFLYYEHKQFESALIMFQKCCISHPQKIQPLLCTAITQVNLYHALKHGQNLQQAKQTLKQIARLTGATRSNIGAYAYYHKSVVHAYMQQWKQALDAIDEAIEKSEQNYWKFFYLRGLILACIHSFADAISDCSTAISLSSHEGGPYLLRSCCLQIEGEGNMAFKDLQAYIALAPEDKQVHMLAGKLLFENGAFEDAITAFFHEPIAEQIRNQDAFMTISKTYFLLGRFDDAASYMAKVYEINNLRTQARFDSKMISLLSTLLSPTVNYPQMLIQIDQIYSSLPALTPKTQIFKSTQKHTLKSICYFQSGQHDLAIRELEHAILSKQKSVMKEALMEGATREDEKDTKLYIYQMTFNIALCWLMLGDIEEAKCAAGKIAFSVGDVFYEPYRRYMAIFDKKTTPPGHEDQYVKVEVFPSRNKLSNFLSDVSFSINGRTVTCKLCIPFPKVQPPQIFPTFDSRLLKQFSVDRIQRKPEAPWISREEDAIVFTSKIQKYSWLQIEESATEMSLSEQGSLASVGRGQSEGQSEGQSQGRGDKKAMSSNYYTACKQL